MLTVLRKAGFEAYFAGGCVRDRLMGLEPKDYDIATSALPDQVRSLFRNSQAVGAAFGVILVRHGKSQIEVATFRRDLRYVDGRHPSKIEFSSAKEDARRRDFTINGVFYDPLEDRILDFVEGQKDLSERRLRAIGEPRERFAEDHLRVLRAVRFASRFQLNIDPATKEAMVRNAGDLARISPERIAEELKLILCAATRSDGWALLCELELAEVIWRFYTLPTDTGLRAFEAAESIFCAVGPQDEIDWALALSAGVLDYASRGLPAGADIRPLLESGRVHQAVRSCRKGLKISNQATDQMEFILRATGELLSQTPPGTARLKRFYAHADSAMAIELLRGLERVGIQRQRVAWLEEQFAKLEQVDCAPIPLLSGEDLLAAGLAAGPLFKKLLWDVYDAQLEGRIADRDSALKMALKLAKDRG